ncbi:MAG TPA: NAD(P)-dependent oxidoreductase [Solirubrobacteraceae bacterium]|nr:NAD(P)-dependent oxidoreductase [Solirubrobacteraceae bacterium]
MRVFVAGATGAIGRALVPLLLEAGHEVTGMTRSAERASELERTGAEAVVADALEADAVRQAVAAASPEVVVHQLTALPQRIDPRKLERDFALNDRLRSEGTAILVDAAREAGARRVIAQSIAFMYEPGPPGTVHDEQDPLLEHPPPAFARTRDAVATLERTVLAADGVVLRYGYFYGPGTALSGSGSTGADLRRRRFPVVGRGTGVWSLIHIRDAARATVAALTHGTSGTYNIVDDHPAQVAEWLPALARAIGAPRPLRLPAWVARLAAGSYGVEVMTRAQGASNARARADLGWQPELPSWREGFAADLG